MKSKKLVKPVEFEGVGIHSGKYSKIILEHNTKLNGINFIVENKIIPADIGKVVDTTRATTIGYDNIKINTVEHLLSALYCLYITDVNIYIWGDEIPAMDGSSGVFVEKILSSGLEETDKEIEIVSINNTFKFEVNNSRYEVSPAKEFFISCKLNNTPSEIVNNTQVDVKITDENYIKEIAYAKTFCYYDEVQNILSQGYGHGGNLNNVIVINKNKIINPEILTYKRDEFVRHKILDFLGDFSLTKKYVNAKFVIENPSHYANIEFCKKLLYNII